MGAVKRFAENPSRDNARELTSLAAKAHVIDAAPFCQCCGRTDSPLEAHHADYMSPYLVVWVCKTCHRLMDTRRREREAAEAETIDGEAEIDPKDPHVVSLRKYAEATGRSMQSIYHALENGGIRGAAKHRGRWYVDTRLAMAAE